MQKDERRQRKIVLGITAQRAWKLLITFVIGLLIGRIHIQQTIYPFGMAYMLAAYRYNRKINPYMATGGVFAAMALNSSQMQQPVYYVSVIAVCAALLLAAGALQLQENYMVCFCTAAISYLFGTLAFRMHMLLAVATSLLEFGVTVLVIPVLGKALEALHSQRTNTCTEEEVICFCFVGLLCVMGMGDLGIAGICLREILCAWVAVTAGCIGGAAMGAASGAAAAFACTVAGTDGLFIGYMGILGLASGVCKNYGRLACAGAGVAISILSAAYIGYGRISAAQFLSVGIGILLLLLLPGYIVDRLREYVDHTALQEQQWQLRQQRFRELTCGRLTETADALQHAAELLEQTTSTEENEQITYALAEIPEIACCGCTFYRNCWQEEFEHTYIQMQSLYNTYREKGVLRDKDLGQFSRKCLRTQRLLGAAGSVFEKYEINRYWERRLSDSRAVIAKQLNGTGSVLHGLVEEFSRDIQFSKTLQDEIREACDKALLEVREVSVVQAQMGMQIDILLRTSNPAGAERIAQQTIGAVCGLPMRSIEVPRQQDSRGKLWRLSFEAAKTYGIQIGVASAAKTGSELSGDAHSHEALKDGRYMLMLCDGMGSGRRAAHESRLAVSLMEEFYKVGYREQDIIDIINKLLLLSSSDDIYSTLDLAMLDLMQGTVRFIKIGAPHSYIIGERGVHKLKAGSLPMGILNEYEPLIYEAQLEVGDTILMFTDGIAEPESMDDELHTIIRKTARLRNAQEIADRILQAVQQTGNGENADDMTVIAARITKPFWGRGK